MKITKKQPLRPRGRSEDKRQSTKNVIRDAYINGPQKEVQIIPAKRDMEAETEKKKLRVCAYCRVSTDEDTQASSYELQVQNYTRMIRENPEWEFAGIFADEGISGTSVLHREHFLEMIEKCKAGEIDLIITKQVSRFARNVLDSLNYIFMLRKLDPPVGVYFETEKLNTLDKSSDMVITVLSLVAQSESEQKSNSLKWSFKRRRAQGLGIYPSWALLGYRLDDDEKNWEIVEDECYLGTEKTVCRWKGQPPIQAVPRLSQRSGRFSRSRSGGGNSCPPDLYSIHGGADTGSHCKGADSGHNSAPIWKTTLADQHGGEHSPK